MDDVKRAVQQLVELRAAGGLWRTAGQPIRDDGGRVASFTLRRRRRRVPTLRTHAPTGGGSVPR